MSAKMFKKGIYTVGIEENSNIGGKSQHPLLGLIDGTS